jgi:hypothetical protein
MLLLNHTFRRRQNAHVITHVKSPSWINFRKIGRFSCSPESLNRFSQLFPVYAFAVAVSIVAFSYQYRQIR